ncbi:hypothetical protein IPA_07365 [Ignicoccus pacificus DSM 13166]|uniref:Uncharacterized protein n=1 Tax=Ignicoccus pacificus DSM 13166 TaxID=940294 RepID=A0A977KAZ6_9CREN|nr:hypothetical protein IPA_07365 [Ignicoccus pacificus DSM 13166]
MERLDDLVSLMLIGALVALTTAMMLVNSKKKKEEEKKFITVLKCPKCGFQKERDWKQGDFVGLVEGKCPKCGALMEVYAIYKEGEEEEEETKSLIPI